MTRDTFKRKFFPGKRPARERERVDKVSLTGTLASISWTRERGKTESASELPPEGLAGGRFAGRFALPMLPLRERELPPEDSLAY